MKFKYILIFLALSILFSCKDNGTQNEPTDRHDYLPLSIGSYWIYQTYELNQYQDTITGTARLDSLVCENIDVYAGRTAYFIVRYRNGILFDTLILSKSSDSVFRLFNKNNFSVPDLSDVWFKIAEQKTLDWNLLGIRFTNYPFYFIDKQVLTTFDHAVNVYFRGFDSLTLQNKKYQQIHFELKHDSRLFFDYNFKYTITVDSIVYDTISPGNIKVDTIKVNRQAYDSVQVNRQLLEMDRYFFVNKIGLTKLQKDTYYEQMWTIPYTSRFPGGRKYFNGWRSILIRYKL